MQGESTRARAIVWGAAATTTLAVLIVVGSRNLAHFDAALVGYTFATLFATFGITYRYVMWLRRPPTRMYWRRGWQTFLAPRAWPRTFFTLSPSDLAPPYWINSHARVRVAAAQRTLFLRIAVHLAAGYRLLRKRRAEVDAVLSADGRVVHAEAAARTSGARSELGDAARAIDRARGRMRRASPEEALAMWKGLVAGQWSLVDHVDTDGRRYLFAKRNTPDARPWHDLTDRERQVLAYAAEGQPHKVIAYELGITVPTVSMHLKSAATRVGVDSRAALIRAYRATRDASP